MGGFDVPPLIFLKMLSRYQSRLTHLIILALLIGFAGNSCVPGNIQTEEPEIFSIKVINNEINILTTRINVVTDKPDQLILEVRDINSSTNDNVTIFQRIPESGQIRYDIVGLKENTDYVFNLIDSNTRSALFEGHFKTTGIPKWMKDFLPRDDAELGMEGLILLNTFPPPNNQSEGGKSALYILDSAGKLVLARASDNRIFVARLTPRNTLLTMHSDFPGSFGSNIIMETSLAGDTLVYFEYGNRGFDRMVRHDVIMTKSHNFIAITEFEKDGVLVDGLTKLDRSGNKIWEWDTSTHYPTHSEPYNHPWANSVYFDDDDNLIISFRRLSQIWKLDRNDRRLIWKFGINGTIPLTGNDRFLLQHTAQIIPDNRIILFDNGQDGNAPFPDSHRPFSRIGVYQLDHNQASVLSSKFIDLPEKYFSWAMGSVEYLDESGTFLVGASWPGYILHVNENSEILGELKLGNVFYRVSRIPDFRQKHP